MPNLLFNHRSSGLYRLFSPLVACAWLFSCQSAAKVELVTPQNKISACRDPKDNKFLEAALAGEADCIVSGDADLLVLTPFEDIPILRPAEVLAKL
jgi:predicted nucleic acid-binding protein